MNPGGAASSGPPRALLVVLRGLGVAHLGCYGNEWLSTRSLDRLACRGVVFDQHYAADDWRACIPPPNGAVVSHVQVPRPERDVAELRPLRHEVYRACETVPSDRPSLIVVETDSLLPPWDPPADLSHYYFGDYSDDPEADPPLSPWVDPLPTACDDETIERLQNTFAAQLTAVDISLTKLFAGCRRRGFGAKALTVVTSDHALSLAEPSVEAEFHLPLIVRLPGNELSGLRMSALTRPGDVGDLIGGYLQGVDSATIRLIRGIVPSLHDHLPIAGKAIRTADYLYVRDGDADHLYIKPDDRWEKNDLAVKRPDDVDRLRTLLSLSPGAM